MNLQKTGMYLAQKRKELGLTQKQLAEKLGMSDKSVSKWERGICLPDVSVYIELCNILGITINEFLAGEDIQIEEIEKKSESNLLYIIKDSKQIQKNFKKIIYLLSISLFAMIVIVGTAIYKQNAAKNYMEPLSKDSLEVKTAELLSGPEGAFLFRYHTTNPFKLLTFYVTEYQNGKLVSKREVGLMDYSDYESPKEGIIALVPQFDKGFIRLIEADNEVKYSTEIPILEREESSEYSGSAAVSIQDQENIHYNNEQSLIAFLYGKNGIPTLPIENIEAGEVDNFKNGYVYYFSVEFDKKAENRLLLTCHSTTVIYKTRVRSLIFRLATLAYHRRILFTDFFSQSRQGWSDQPCLTEAVKNLVSFLHSFL